MLDPSAEVAIAKVSFLKDESIKEEETSFEEGDGVKKINTSFGSVGVLKVESSLDQ